MARRRRSGARTSPAAARRWEAHDGATLQSYVFGRADAKPERRVLIVCGAFLPAKAYAPFAAALVRHLGDDWGVHVYDRRGKGRSSPVDEDYTFETELHDVATGLRRSGARHLIGHSLGGAIVLHAVRRLCDAGDGPEGEPLRALIPRSTTVYDPAINVDGSIDTSWLPQFEAHVDAGRIGRAMALVERHLGMSRTLSHAPTWMVSGVLALSTRTGLRGTTRQAMPAGVAELTAAFREEARAVDFAGLPTRTCLMTGERSAEYFQATSLALANSVPDSRLIVSPRALHGSVPAVRHRIPESLALWLRERPLGDLDLGPDALRKLPKPSKGA
ncbi:alpha/beta hydrolase [Gulosibacter sp. 10]|uniref:alpha/beta hydrolase n=1 Tax=Gulosibacter sp. 10 TaxID=1255570 RepID=UPI00097F43F4|nr:alpha/beta hydrolase [Gulosibacter sp. 10]SJM61756.1 putative hydrolase [Gulosibacter sp. 10]